MKLLVIDCCIRGDLSGTKKLYEAYLKTLGSEVEIETLTLYEQDLQPMLMEDITKRIDLLAAGQYDHEMFRYAHQFINADRILIAAPYWDWSFPSLLKVYLEHVSVSGLTFRYEGAQCIGQCKADKILYFATCGSYLDNLHQGVEYIKEIGAMFGIHEVEAHVIEGLDVEPEQREPRLNQGIQDMLTRIGYMTGKLYYKDSHIKEFEAEVVACEEWKDGYRIVLNQTAFFPEGGGQAGDTGVLEVIIGQNTGEAPEATVDGNTGEALETAVDRNAGEVPEAVVDGNTGEAKETAVGRNAGEASEMTGGWDAGEASEMTGGWNAGEAPKTAVGQNMGEIIKTSDSENTAEQSEAACIQSETEAAIRRSAPEQFVVSGTAAAARLIHVTDTKEKNGCIYHMTDAPLPVGTKVVGRLNFEQRFDRMQQHTGEHIISGIVHGMFGCDNVGFHLGDDITTLDFNLDLDEEQVREVEMRANQAVFANLPIKVLYPGKEELKEMDYRSKIEIEGQVRIVSIPGIDLCACCAPHTYTTGEVGLIKILSCDRHRGGCRMVMVSGMRALRDYKEKQNSVTEVSVLLSAKPDAIGAAVAHAKEQQMKLREQLNQIQAVYLKDKLEAIGTEDRLVCIFEEEMDNVAVRNFINEAMERCNGICAAFVGTDESGYRYILGSRTANMREVSKVLNEKFAGKGGGKPEMVQGSLTGCEAEIREALESMSDVR